MIAGAITVFAVIGLVAVVLVAYAAFKAGPLPPGGPWLERPCMTICGAFSSAGWG